jgi:autotransporter translocation and assembly factor TamB
VRRNDFEVNIRTELALAYRDPDLNVGGYIEFSGGEFEVFGKRFDINSGALRFDGGTELNPDVFLLATQRPDVAGTSPVTISVTGTLAEPVVTFNSDVCPGDEGAVTYLVSGRCAADDPDVAEESGGARAAVTSGILSGVLTLGAQRELGGLLPRIAIETSDEAQRVRAGISSDSLVPKFMRKLVQRVYVQGGVGVSSGSSDTATAEQEAATGNPLDFLIELYFPHSIVGSGRFAQETWGLDVTWEP